MRFSDEEYLRAWRDDKVWPKIHEPMYSLFASTFEAKAVMDLCCCTGLIGQHIQDSLRGVNVFGVEGDPDWIKRGRKWGIDIPIFELWIVPERLPDFVNIIETNKITGIVARRCISEIFGNDAKGRHLDKPNYPWAEQFTAAIAQAGIKEIWIEGRADQGRSTHCIPSTEAEAKCFASKFKLADSYKKCQYLTLK